MTESANLNETFTPIPKCCTKVRRTINFYSTSSGAHVNEYLSELPQCFSLKVQSCSATNTFLPVFHGEGCNNSSSPRIPPSVFLRDD